MSRGTLAVIDLAALEHNFAVVKKHAPHSKVLSIVKADAYGHGIVPVASVLSESDGFGVACFEEAVLLREAGIGKSILMMEGVLSVAELQEAAGLGLDLVVHQQEQLRMLEQSRLPQPVTVWLKLDTGMHRLGITADCVGEFLERLQACPQVGDTVVMSHFSCADEFESPATEQQYQRFSSLLSACGYQGQMSLANSAGICRSSNYHLDWVRPGLMLYGASPLLGKSANDLDLRPVMTLQSKVIALRSVQQGDAVGYGGNWVADRPHHIAMVSIGYGDGYPRHIGENTQVLVGGRPCPVVGRVSMDMIAVNVDALPTVNIGDNVVLWGAGLPVEDLASQCETINYELLCQVTGRVEREFRT